MNDRRTITLAIELDVTAFEDVCGLTDDQLNRAVWDATESERNELAAAMRLAAMLIMEGRSA